MGAYRVPFPVQMQCPKGGEIGYISVFGSLENAIKFNNGNPDNICALQDA